jgi:acetyltransferase-like isoleucine patch superfamily enzyme
MTVLQGAMITAGDYGNGNKIVGTPRTSPGTTLTFAGSNCTATFGPGSTVEGHLSFRRDDSSIAVGERSVFRGLMSLGLGCEISVGDGLYCGAGAYLTTAEGASITLGNDLLISERFQARADDSHPIYDGVTGRRINVSKSITVGDHVWIGADVILMPGATVGSGSILGIRSMVTKSRPVPENCLAVGSPAEIQRRQVVWVRKHLQSGLDVDDAIEPVFVEYEFMAAGSQLP